MEDEGKKDKKFKVRLQRTERRHYILEVEAKSEVQAQMLALNQAGDINFYDGSCSDPEYEVEDVEEAGDDD
jgi:hypothetical protein